MSKNNEVSSETIPERVMPETIYAWPDSNAHCGGWHDRTRHSRSIEYVRVDVHETVEQQIGRLLEKRDYVEIRAGILGSGQRRYRVTEFSESGSVRVESRGSTFAEALSAALKGESKCRKCGRGANEINGYLHRVNEKGVIGIWECRPYCLTNISKEDAIMRAITGEDNEPVS